MTIDGVELALYAQNHKHTHGKNANRQDYSILLVKKTWAGRRKRKGLFDQ